MSEQSNTIDNPERYAATSFENGDELNFHVPTSERLTPSDEFQAVKAAYAHAAEALAAPGEREAVISIGDVQKIGSVLVEMRRYEKDSRLNIFDRAA